MENMRENIYLDCLVGGKGERFWYDSIIQVFFSQTQKKKKKKKSTPLWIDIWKEN